MAYRLGDVYIGHFPIIQNFGEKPDIYSARYNLKGHNGIDFGCPSLTMVLSAANGTVSETGFDNGGYGNFIEIIHEGFKTKYAHLNDIVVKQNDKVICGQLIGHTNNTGNSDTPHLHFGIAPLDSAGNKSHKDNGYGGYIDPSGAECEWEIMGLQEPVIQQMDISPKVPTDAQELSIKSTHSNSFLQVVMFGLQHGLPLDENNNFNADDPNAGKRVNMWIAGLLENKVSPTLSNENDIIGQKPPRVSGGFFSKIRDFTFVQK